MAASDYDLLIQQSEEELRLLTAAHDNAWHLSEAAWNVNQDAGTLEFTSPGGVRAICRVQIIGTYNTDDGTWLWAWDHPSVVSPLRAHAQTVLEYGTRHGIAELTMRKVACAENDAWRFAALACRLNRAQGAYRGPASPALVFMTFTDVQLSKVAEDEAEDPGHKSSAS